MQPQPKLDPLTEIALRSLKDIDVPMPIPWYPQTWGWALLAVLFAAGLATWLAFAVRRYRRDAYRREALRLMTGIEQTIRDPACTAQNLGLLAALLKRTALAAWPREKVSHITGPDWIAFLDATGGQGIGQALSRFLGEAEYRGDAAKPLLSPDEAEEIVRDARRWIGEHHVSA